MDIKRKLKILKAILLLRKVNKYESKEAHGEEYAEECAKEYAEEYEEEPYISSCTAGDYSPSHPWDALGMSISDFMPGCR